MNHRTVIGPYAKESMIRKRAAAFAQGKAHRIEFFAWNLLNDPYKVVIIDGD